MQLEEQVKARIAELRVELNAAVTAVHRIEGGIAALEEVLKMTEPKGDSQ